VKYDFSRKKLTPRIGIKRHDLILTNLSLKSNMPELQILLPNQLLIHWNGQPQGAGTKPKKTRQLSPVFHSRF
jgi:hypothetical protein